MYQDNTTPHFICVYLTK